MTTSTGSPVVILPSGDFSARRIFIAPSTIAHARSYVGRTQEWAGLLVHMLVKGPGSVPPRAGGCGLADYENNFGLSAAPTA